MNSHCTYTGSSAGACCVVWQLQTQKLSQTSDVPMKSKVQSCQACDNQKAVIAVIAISNQILQVAQLNQLHAAYYNKQTINLKGQWVCLESWEGLASQVVQSSSIILTSILTQSKKNDLCEKRCFKHRWRRPAPVLSFALDNLPLSTGNITLSDRVMFDVSLGQSPVTPRA